MPERKSQLLADEISTMAVRLARWLRAVDQTPALSGPQASAMAVIVYSGGITPSALADLEQVRRPTITRLVDELVLRGLVSRAPHPSDRRGSILSATEKGLQIWKAGQLRRAAPLADRIEALSNDEAQQLENILPLLRHLFEPD